MMNTYVVEMMTYETYTRYMRGDLFFGNVTRVHIQAETKEQAIAKAEEQYKSYEINKNYVKTVEELLGIERQKELEKENDKELRNKAIDEFAEKLKNAYEAYDLDDILSNNDVFSYSNSCGVLESYIDEIAEQMKNY